MRRFVRTLGAPLLLAMTGAACSAAPRPAAEIEPENDDAAGTATEGINADDVCSVVSKISNIVLGSTPVSVTTIPGCNADTASQLTYLGGAAPGAFATSNPRVEAQALYCAIQGADGHYANGLFDTPLGKMGIQSHVAINTKDPRSLHVAGQRLGKLYAFGLSMDIESQKFDFSFPTEYQYAQGVRAVHLTPVASPTGHGTSYIAAPYTQNIPAQTGQYALMTESGHHFAIDADIPIPTPVPGLTIHTGLRFHHGTPYDAANNFAYGMTTPSAPESPFAAMYHTEARAESVRRGGWDAETAACNACAAAIPAGGLDTCGRVCADGKQTSDHERQCANGSCSDSYYRNLTDGRLPYEGTYGASGPFLDDGVPHNWWHFGTPGASNNVIGVVSGEPVYVQGSGPSDPALDTSSFSVNLGVHYGYSYFDLSFQLDTSFDWRNGLAVRENQLAPGDLGSHGTNETATWIDSEGRALVTARAALDVNLPVVGKQRVLDKSFQILNKSARSSSSSHAVTTTVDWTDADPSAITGYTVGGTTQSIATCLSVPPSSSPPVEIANPADFATAVSQKAKENVFPCNIRVCDPSSHLETCTWNSATSSVSCVQTAQPCTCADDNLDMCDAAGNVYKGTDVGTNDCKQQQPCGSAAVCSTASDCPYSASRCNGGCCERLTH